VEVEPPKETYKGIIYLPKGNAVERIGHASGKVQGVSKGYYEMDKKGKRRFVLHEVKTGDRVVFRGHLKDHNTYALPKDHFLIHVNDLIGVLEDGAELDLSLPYDN
jgi:co-chaperonin GroES (HSP10)